MAQSKIPRDMPGILSQETCDKQQEVDRTKDDQFPRWVIDSAPDSQSRQRETAESGWINFFQDIFRFVTEEIPNSERADEEGIAMGEFIIDNPALAAIMKVKRDALQDMVGSTPKVSVTYFKNWASTSGSGLLLHAKPTTVAEVALLVEKARELDLKVGCGGAYHSWSPIFPDNSTIEQQGLLINTSNLELENSDGRKIKFGRHGNEVIMSPGATTGEMLDFSLNNNVCLESNAILLTVTYGGLFSTGCHGVGKDQTGMSDWVVSMKVVNHLGEVKNYPNDFPPSYTEQEKRDAMNAVRTSMAVFGINVEFTVSVKPMQYAITQNQFPTVGQLFYGPNPSLKQLLKDNWSVQCMWFPFNSLGLINGLLQSIPTVNIWQSKADEVWVRLINKTDETAETNRWDKVRQKLRETTQHVLMNAAGSPLIARYPQFVPVVGGISIDLVKGNLPAQIHEELSYAVHFRYGVSIAPVYDMEFAFPLTLDDDEHGFDKLFEAVQYAVDETQKAAEGILGSGIGSTYPLSTTLDIRVIKKSEALLCPATPGKGDTSTHTAFVEILSFAGNQAYENFFHKIGERWVAMGGVPHWCKQWTFLEDVGVFEQIHSHYEDNLTKFRKVLDDIGDPTTMMFINETMQKVLYPVPLGEKKETC